MGQTEQTPPESTEQPSPEPTQRVALPDRLVSRVERRLPRTDFDAPEAYVAYVLEEVLAQVETESEDSYEQVDGDEVEDRLKSLGYLD